MSKNKIDVSQIPPVERKNLAKTFLEAVERFFDDPKNLQDFEEWKKSQEDKDKNADQRRKAHDNHDNCSGGNGVCCIGGINGEEHCTV